METRALILAQASRSVGRRPPIQRSRRWLGLKSTPLMTSSSRSSLRHTWRSATTPCMAPYTSATASLVILEAAVHSVACQYNAVLLKYNQQVLAATLLASLPPLHLQ